MQLVTGGRAPIGVLDEGSGPAVLILHGFPDTVHGMGSIARAVVAAGGRAIAVALPGYLPSPAPPDNDLRAVSVATDLVGVLDTLGIEDVAVVGHDWGALLAYDLGARHAHRVRSIVGLAAPHPVGFRVRRRIVREQQTGAYAWLLAYATSGPDLVADPHWLTQLAQVWSPGLRRDDWDDVLALMAVPAVAAAVCRWYRCDLDADDPLGDVLVPATVIHGAQDGCIGPAVFVAADGPFKAGLNRILLPEVGHWLHLEDPATVLPLILRGVGL